MNEITIVIITVVSYIFMGILTSIIALFFPCCSTEEQSKVICLGVVSGLVLFFWWLFLPIMLIQEFRYRDGIFGFRKQIK